MHSPDFDVIIVGAGPAGCAATYRLREHGLTVLLIDKYEFPRVKPCAGGLTVKALRALPYSVDPIVKRVCYNVAIGAKTAKPVLYRGKLPVCAMTIRAEFDHFCLAKTLEKGAVFQIHQKISGIEHIGSLLKLHSEKGTISACYLIGADGANSLVRKLTEAFPGIRKGIAIEGRVALPEQWKPEMEFSIGAVKNGYGWLFPKHDHVNVGLYSNDLDAGLNKAMLHEYCRKKLNTNEIDHVVGHHVGLGGHHYSPGLPNVFLVGDAAGLVDPLLGEGIYNAIKSGQMAAEAIAQAMKTGQPALEAYRQQLEILQTDLRSSRDFSIWVYRNTRLACWLLSFPLLKSFIMKGFASGLTFFELKACFFRGVSR